MTFTYSMATRGDVSAVLSDLSGISRNDVRRLSSAQVYEKAVGGVLKHEACVIHRNGRPVALFWADSRGEGPAVTYFLAKQEYFDYAKGSVRVSRRILRETAAQKGPLLSQSIGEDAQKTRWFELLGFTSLGGGLFAYGA